MLVLVRELPIYSERWLGCQRRHDKSHLPSSSRNIQHDSTIKTVAIIVRLLYLPYTSSVLVSLVTVGNRGNISDNSDNRQIALSVGRLLVLY